MTDEELARRAQAGNQDAFMELAHRYQNLVFRLAHRFGGTVEDGLDLGQICLITAYRQLAKYDPRRPFKPWLTRLCVNACINWSNSNRRKAFELSIFDEALRAPGDVEGETLETIRRSAVLEALQTLPPDTRALIILRYVTGNTLREIAEMTGTKLSTAANRINRGLDTLRASLSSAGVNEP